MKIKDYSIVEKKLLEEWFSEEEITKIIQWYKDIDNGNIIPAEDIFKEIMKQEVQHV